MKLQQMRVDQSHLKKCLELVAQERQDAAQFVREHKAPENRDFRALASYILGSQARATAMQSALRKLDTAVAEQKSRVMSAEKKEKLLAKLREKRFQEWTHEVNQQVEADAQECWTTSWKKRR